MGAVNGKATAENESEPPVSGIRVTDGLVRQLRQEHEPEPPVQRAVPGGPLFPFYRPAARFAAQTSDSSESTTDSHHRNSAANEPQTKAETPSKEPAAESSKSHSNNDHAGQAMHEEVQQLAEPKALKAEAASQQQVKQYADQLAEEYETPLKYLPCQEEKTSCLECYQHHQKDPLRCASQVEAFTQCARRASAAMVS